MGVFTSGAWVAWVCVWDNKGMLTDSHVYDNQSDNIKRLPLIQKKKKRNFKFKHPKLFEIQSIRKRWKRNVFCVLCTVQQYNYSKLPLSIHMRGFHQFRFASFFFFLSFVWQQNSFIRVLCCCVLRYSARLRSILSTISHMLLFCGMLCVCEWVCRYLFAECNDAKTKC